MPLNDNALVMIGLLLAAWSIAAGVAILWATRRTRRAEADWRLLRRLSRVFEESPAQPLLVRADGKIEGSPRLAGWLGFSEMPGYLSELITPEAGLDEAQLGELMDAIRRTQRTGAPFRLLIAPRNSRRTLEVRGTVADPQVAAGAVLAWVFDFTEHAADVERLSREARAASASYNGLAGLLEAAPMPMWFRGPDLKLMLVNSAYVDAVDGESAEATVARQCELLERIRGKTPAEVAGEALLRGAPVEREVSATIHGQRRALRVRDLPLDGGVAGFAWDIQDFEEQKRAFRAFRDAQRQMLDTLSAAIAQFDGGRRLTFTNESFLRLFGLSPNLTNESPLFERLLETMRDNGRLPEVRDFPQWRRERLDWFTSGAVQQEEWRLGDGAHWRVVAQSTPDGGLLLIFEDRTEQLQLAATRDTLLRTRAATFDNLFESLAVFQPDGRLQLWNRRFAAEWGLSEAFLDGHPHVDDLLGQIAPRLRQPQQVSDVGSAIRAATLERIGRGGRLALADGRHLEFAGVPLPDGNGLLTALDITGFAERAVVSLAMTNHFTIPLPDLARSEVFGAKIAAALQPGDVVALSGGLGAGKTTLARAILSALGHIGEVPSPSFSIIELYEPPDVRLPVVHADFYRMSDLAELSELGLDEYRSGAALLAEWPEHAGGFETEPACLSITLEPAENGRTALVRLGSEWLQRGGWS